MYGDRHTFVRVSFCESSVCYKERTVIQQKRDYCVIMELTSFRYMYSDRVFRRRWQLRKTDDYVVQLFMSNDHKHYLVTIYMYFCQLRQLQCISKLIETCETKFVYFFKFRRKPRINSKQYPTCFSSTDSLLH